MTDKVQKTIVGLALATLGALPALAQNPSPGCEDGEVLINGECTDVEEIITVTGSQNGSSGGQSGLGGGTGATSSGSSNNGYNGRPGGGSGGRGTAPTPFSPPSCPVGQEPQYIADGSGVPVWTGCRDKPTRNDCQQTAGTVAAGGAMGAAAGVVTSNPVLVSGGTVVAGVGGAMYISCFLNPN